MTRKTRKPRRSQGKFEEISVDALRDISLRFPGDVYWLAVWIAMSDLAASTPTSRSGTTLHGLANKFASLAYSFGQPWTAERVMAQFREHGLAGNPVIRLPPEHAEAVAAFIRDGRSSAVGNSPAARLESGGGLPMEMPHRNLQ